MAVVKQTGVTGTPELKSSQLSPCSICLFLMVATELVTTQGLLIAPSSNSERHSSDNLWHGAAQLRCTVTKTNAAVQ